MSKVKIGIVEDEIIIADTISATLLDLGYDVVEPVGNYTDALAMIEKEKPDLLLLDIQLGGKKDGIDVAEVLKDKFNIPFIFLTANADTATIERAKQVEPPAYLVKPFNKDDLYSSIEICLYNFNKKSKGLDKKSPEQANYFINEAIFIKDGHIFIKVPFSEILYLESDHVYVNVHTKSKTYLVRASMLEYMENFDPMKFFRVHRSFTVNLDKVEGINELFILVGGVQIPMGKTYREDLLSKIRLG